MILNRNPRGTGGTVGNPLRHSLGGVFVRTSGGTALRLVAAASALVLAGAVVGCTTAATSQPSQAGDQPIGDSSMAMDAPEMGQEGTMGQADMESAISGEEHGDMEDYTFGAPGDPAASTRVIDIATRDSLEFDPKTIEVNAGETVTLRVTNNGTLTHDFALGDKAMQDAHEEEMAAMGGVMMADEPNAMALEPGQTKEMVWTFSEPGEVLYACHSPGHYAAGMVGTITVKQ